MAEFISQVSCRLFPSVSDDRIMTGHLINWSDLENPPPCTLFYLSNCKHGAECKYAHDYILEPEHFQEIRSNAKKSPCPARNKGE